MTKVKGRVRKFGDNIDTDIITPGPFLQLPIEEMKKYAFSPIYPDFYKSVKEGDIILGGSNFGCGSSREQATSVVKALGIKYIVCESMARIYFRNCIGLGIYPIISEGVSEIFEEGDEIEIDLIAGEVKNLKTNKKTYFIPLKGTPLEIFEAGGILSILKKKIENEKSI